MVTENVNNWPELNFENNLSHTLNTKCLKCLLSKCCALQVFSGIIIHTIAKKLKAQALQLMKKNNSKI